MISGRRSIRSQPISLESSELDEIPDTWLDLKDLVAETMLGKMLDKNNLSL